MAVSTAACRIAVPEILSWENEMGCTKVLLEEDAVSNTISAEEILADDEE